MKTDLLLVNRFKSYLSINHPNLYKKLNEDRGFRLGSGIWGLGGLPWCPIVEGAPGRLAGRRWRQERLRRGRGGSPASGGGGGGVQPKLISVGWCKRVEAGGAGGRWLWRGSCTSSVELGRREEHEGSVRLGKKPAAVKIEREDMGQWMINQRLE